METNLFNGKTALIVGGTGGIGRELSLALAQTGARLVIHGGHESEQTRSLIHEIKKISGKKPLLFTQNLLERLFFDLEDSPLLLEARKCDILCVCFGPFVQKPLHETSLSDWEKVALYDYALPGLLVSAALPRMMENRFGRILLFGGTGTARRTEFATNAAYAGAKSALNVLVSSTAANYAEYGITCNAILPGFVETEYLSEPKKAELGAKMPLGSLISARSVAESAIFLLKNADINGTSLSVDRGWSPSKNISSGSAD